MDDYQSNTETGTSSSGGAVIFDVANLHEGRLDDGNTDLTWMPFDPMNGMTRNCTGRTSTIPIGSYGAITRPYQRTGMGTGAGWANEFNTVRIRLVDFENDGTGIDLGDVAAVRLQFGSGFGSPRGRLGIDDLELTRD